MTKLKGEAHQNAPGRPARPTPPRRASTRTHARDPGVASSSPLPWGMGDAYAVCGASMCPLDMGGGGRSPLGSFRPLFNDFRADTTLWEGE